MLTIWIAKWSPANMYQISSPWSIPGYATKIGHIPTHFYPPAKHISLAFFKRSVCVWVPYASPRRIRRNPFGLRRVITLTGWGEITTRKGWNFAREIHDAVRATIDIGCYINGAMSHADFTSGGGKTTRNTKYSCLIWCYPIPHLPGCFCPWTFFQNIGFNMVPSDPCMSHLATQLWYSAGEFQALQLIVLATCRVVD